MTYRGYYISMCAEGCVFFINTVASIHVPAVLDKHSTLHCCTEVEGTHAACPHCTLHVVLCNVTCVLPSACYVTWLRLLSLRNCVTGLKWLEQPGRRGVADRRGTRELHQARTFSPLTEPEQTSRREPLHTKDLSLNSKPSARL